MEILTRAFVSAFCGLQTFTNYPSWFCLYREAYVGHTSSLTCPPASARLLNFLRATWSRFPDVPNATGIQHSVLDGCCQEAQEPTPGLKLQVVNKHVILFGGSLMIVWIVWWLVHLGSQNLSREAGQDFKWVTELLLIQFMGDEVKNKVGIQRPAKSGTRNWRLTFRRRRLQNIGKESPDEKVINWNTRKSANASPTYPFFYSSDGSQAHHGTSTNHKDWQNILGSCLCKRSHKIMLPSRCSLGPNTPSPRHIALAVGHKKSTKNTKTKKCWTSQMLSSLSELSKIWVPWKHDSKSWWRSFGPFTASLGPTGKTFKKPNKITKQHSIFMWYIYIYIYIIFLYTYFYF